MTAADKQLTSTTSAPPSVTESANLIAEIAQEFPKFRVLEKRNSQLSKCIDLFLKVITLGSQRHFMTRYRTVIGFTLYLPADWSETPEVERVIVLCHERVHLRQRRRYGMVPMALLYLLPFFPLGLAYGRARLEWEAYTETLRATAEFKGVKAMHSTKLRERIVSQFTSGAYGWMWPFKGQVNAWYDAALREIERNLPGPGVAPRQPSTQNDAEQRDLTHRIGSS